MILFLEVRGWNALLISCVGTKYGNISAYPWFLSFQIRGTLRFLLGNLNDFDPSIHTVAYGDLPAVDRYVLYNLVSVMNEASAAYETYQAGL